MRSCVHAPGRDWSAACYRRVLRAEILIVEDEPLICDLLLSALEDEGLDVACPVSPSEAAVQLKRHSAALRVLVTDVNLKFSSTGFDVARDAQRRLPAIAVLYTTRHAEADIGAQGVDGGDDGGEALPSFAAGGTGCGHCQAH